jgi:hypothetical protein
MGFHDSGRARLLPSHAPKAVFYIPERLGRSLALPRLRKVI